MIERRFSAQDGLILAYREWPGPEGPAALLCLPGFARTGRDFAGLAARHAGRRRVVAPDYRGRGESAWDAGARSYRPEVYLDDLRHLMVVARLHRVIVVGTSLGGLLGLGLTLVCAPAVAGIVLNDIGPDIPAGGLAPIRRYVCDPPRPADLDAAAATLQALMPDLSFTTPEQWRHFAELTFAPDPAGGLKPRWDPAIGRGLDLPPPDLWPILRASRRLPVLAIRGGVSRVLQPATLARMQAEHPLLAVVEVPGVGHAPSLDENEAREAIDEFLGAQG
ncbi:MAG: alpha/beta hydrolase [Thalassobaculales bacterium]